MGRYRTLVDSKAQRPRLHTAYVPFVAPAGHPTVFGTNAIAFGFPATAASSSTRPRPATARRIADCGARRKLAPEGAGVEPDGQPTRDPAAILLGAQSPFGGHRSSSIALMVELLAGVLIGQPTSPEAGREEAGSARWRTRARRMAGCCLSPSIPTASAIRRDGAPFRIVLRRIARPARRAPARRRSRQERDRIARDGVTLPAALWRRSAAAGQPACEDRITPAETDLNVAQGSVNHVAA